MGFKEIAVFCKIDIAWDLQKLGIIIENKVHIKLLLKYRFEKFVK